MQKNKLLYKTWIEVDRKALLANVAIVERHIGADVVCMAIIKANAYGHGLMEIAEVLRAKKNIWLGVDSIDEAQILKKMRLKQPIMILGYIPRARLLEAMQENFHISVYHLAILKDMVALLKKNSNLYSHLHLKIETGTNRLGIQLKDLINIKNLPPIEGVYSHFADAENPRSKFYLDQLKTLKKAIWILKQKGVEPRFVHTASSAALLAHQDTHLSLVRLGISLYGLWPSFDVQHSMFDTIHLKPVLQWKTRVAQIKEIQKGETVGYDRTWKAKKKTKIAILPIGYYDGYDRRLSNCGEVLINGKRAKIVGRICMNMVIVDVSGITAKENDEVVLLGVSGKQEITVDDVAKKAGTINYEVVSRINPLLPRIVK